MDTNKKIHDHSGSAELVRLVKEINTCIFCTSLKQDDGSSARPMSALEVDDQGIIWFFSDKDSDKNKEIEKDSSVRLYFSHPGKNSYLIVNGSAHITNDKAKIEQLWTPLAKTWFEQGKEDPNITVIKVIATDAYYWDVEGNRMVNFLKMVASAATGKDFVESKEGSIHF